MSLAMLKTALCCVTLASLASAMPTDCAGILAPEACAGDQYCRWDAAAGTCALRYCSGFATEAKCDAFGDVCNYHAGLAPGWCVDQPCPLPAAVCALQGSKADCAVSRGCSWMKAGPGNGSCVTDWCPATYADQALCEADPRCDWEETVGSCDGEGRYSPATVGKCVNGPCSPYNTPCACAAQQQCAWNFDASACVPQSYADAPGMDLMVIVDGSKSLVNVFGEHENGYKAIIAQLRSFARSAPLTGLSHGQPMSQAKGVNLGFVEFSGNNPFAFMGIVIPGDSKIRTSAATRGNFSGSAAEVDLDLAQLRVNFMQGGSMMEKALVHAVDRFAATDAGSRARVLLVIVDGPQGDEETFAAQAAALDALNVTRFGMVIHDNYPLPDPHTLGSVASSPDHITYTHVDSIHETLADLCTPSGVFGSLVPNPHPSATLSTWYAPDCPLFSVEASCAAESSCSWDAAAALCAANPCVAHCTAVDCAADAGCTWLGGLCA
ncbi:hypothetical protein DIPPA_05120 [Diplonema papillatum]|nr:hypothetical protein DIPPA_05120 [Diplonema papillatum]|eukprot:gene21428-32966_t